MDAIQMKKILDHLYFYFLTVLTCIFFYHLSSLVKVVVFVLIPGSASVLLSSKMLFIVGNLIILAIVVDSRVFFSPRDDSSSSLTTDDVRFYDEYVNSSQTHQWPQISTDAQFKRSKRLQEKNVAEKVKKKMNRREENVVSASDELNKRADEFIARVLRQRRLELGHLKRDRFSLGYN